MNSMIQRRRCGEFRHPPLCSQSGTNAIVMENQTPSQHLLTKVESWIEAHQPENLIMLADRFLVRTIVHHPELQRLLEQSGEVIETLGRAASEVHLVNDPGSCLVLLWCLEDAGLDVTVARTGCESLMPFWEPLIRSSMEPLRSVIRYWQWRTGFITSFEPGPPPQIELYRFYHLVHTIFYKGDYGRKTVHPASVSNERYEVHTLADRFRRNPDVIAELLLVEVLLAPENEYVISHLTEELIGLSEADGRLRVPGGESVQADHHAACVTSLALHIEASKTIAP
jgi:hypothetical protein